MFIRLRQKNDGNTYDIPGIDMSNLTLADALCAARYAGRNPSKKEYETESPAGKRAIYARWIEIRSSIPKTDADMMEIATAGGRYNFYFKEQNPDIFTEAAAWRDARSSIFFEDYIQGDYDSADGVRLNHEHTE